MKKYKLKLKDEFICKYYPSCKWLCGKIKNGDSSKQYTEYEINAFEYTDEEINKMEYGFVNKHSIIEIKEDRYSIVCPITSYCLSEDREDSSLRWLNHEDCNDTKHFKKQFTKSEIKEKFGCYDNECFCIKNNTN